MPSMDDYYEPWTYDYQTLFNAPEGTDQPVARPVSRVTGEYMEIEAGPNFDDDLGGSPVYAENDPNLEGLTPDQREQLFAVERLVFFYFPRICNHCLNPSCVASCPSGALYKRGEDGIVLIDQQRCRAWRSCVAACPYKKTFYNWHHRQIGEVHSLLSPSRDRAGAGLFSLLCRPNPLPRGAPLRRRPDRQDGQPSGRRAHRSPARDDSRSLRHQGDRGCEGENGVPDGVILMPSCRRCISSSRCGRSRCRPISSTAPCRCSFMCRRCRP